MYHDADSAGVRPDKVRSIRHTAPACLPQSRQRVKAPGTTVVLGRDYRPLAARATEWFARTGLESRPRRAEAPFHALATRRS